MQAVPEYKGVVAHRPGIDVGVNAGRDLTLYRRFRIDSLVKTRFEEVPAL